MTGLGLLLLMIGFAFVIPTGAFPGSTANRNVRITNMHVDSTRGHAARAPSGWRRTLIRLLIGVTIMALGALALDRGLRSDEPGSGSAWFQPGRVASPW